MYYIYTIYTAYIHISLLDAVVAAEASSFDHCVGEHSDTLLNCCDIPSDDDYMLQVDAELQTFKSQAKHLLGLLVSL